jgi:hypothetical protein
MKISIIIVNYNRKELLDRCIRSLQQAIIADVDIVIVDNGSADGSLEMIKTHYADCKLIDVGYNSGFCKANNMGIAHALKNNSDAVILLNNDTEVGSNFISEMVSLANNQEKIGMIAANVLIFNDRERIDSNGLLITPDGLAKCKKLNEKEPKNQTTEEVFCPAGAAAFYTRELLEDIEFKGTYFDEDFKLYSEDLDLGWRARLRGWKCLYNPKAIVYHHQSATAGRYSETVGYYVTRNTLFNMLKNYPFFHCCKGMALFFLKYPIFILEIVFKINKGPSYNFGKNISFWKMAKITSRSIMDFFALFPAMIKKRAYIQGRRSVKKKEVNKWFQEFGISFFKALYS